MSIETIPVSSLGYVGLLKKITQLYNVHTWITWKRNKKKNKDSKQVVFLEREDSNRMRRVEEVETSWWVWVCFCNTLIIVKCYVISLFGWAREGLQTWLYEAGEKSGEENDAQRQRVWNYVCWHLSQHILENRGESKGHTGVPETPLPLWHWTLHSSLLLFPRVPHAGPYPERTLSHTYSTVILSPIFHLTTFS